MKSAIVGAGAVGAYLAALMTRAGEDVTLIARGRTLAAITQRGVRVESADGGFAARPVVVESYSAAGPVDVVFLAVKAHSLPAIAPNLAPLLGPETTVVSMQNGIPWWYFTGAERMQCLDPTGAIAAAIEPGRILGSIVYFSTEALEPGVIRHTAGNRLSLGEPTGERSERARQISAMLVHAGLRCPVTTHLRQEIWVKLLGNASFNPISALTGATIVEMVRHPEVSALVRGIMAEVESVATRLGMELPVSMEQRVAGAEKVGEHKTSMLQDLEAGRELELDALVGAVLEIGQRLAIPMPHTQTVYACTKLLVAHRAG
ncbi:MAG: 2-dehydropantoate 2-reductase [Acidobacteriales bacterium]|nr:2-dehydropantoate 2-reductase [Terriglobales bacterium]